LSLYTENEERWKQLSDIDWFTAFTKVWISFNAWYRNHYPDLRTDRKILEEIKNSHNNFKSKFNSLINGIDEKSNYFRDTLGFLQYKLANKEIKHNGIKLSFEEFVEIDQEQRSREETVRGIKYKIIREIPNLYTKIVKYPLIEIKNSRGQEIFKLTNIEISFSDINEFMRILEEKLKTYEQFNRLSDNQKSKFISMLNELTPFKIINLLEITDGENYFECGRFKFRKDENLLFSALVEILYSLRNVLFHGKIIPDKETNEVYEPAYKILKMLVD